MASHIFSYTVYTPSIEATYLNHSQSKFGFWQLRFCGPTLTFQAHSGSGIPTVVGLAAPTRDDAEPAAAAAAEMPPAPKPGTSTSRTLLLQNMFQPTKVGVDWDWWIWMDLVGFRFGFCFFLILCWVIIFEICCWKGRLGFDRLTKHACCLSFVRWTLPKIPSSTMWSERTPSCMQAASGDDVNHKWLTWYNLVWFWQM